MARNTRKRRLSAADRARRNNPTCLAFGNAKPDGPRTLAVSANRARVKHDRELAYVAKSNGYVHEMDRADRVREAMPTMAPSEAKPAKSVKNGKPKSGEKVFPKKPKDKNTNGRRGSNTGNGKPKASTTKTNGKK